MSIKWSIIICDPSQKININQYWWSHRNDQIHIYRLTESEPHEILKRYLDIKRKNVGNIVFVYDGIKWLDGIANDATWTMAYKEFRNNCNHLTSNLIDCWTTVDYTEENGKKLFAEIMYLFYSTFFKNNTLLGYTEDQKIALIKELELIRNN